MSYAAPPGVRMAYDVDGTVGLVSTSGSDLKEISEAGMKVLNSEDSAALLWPRSPQERLVLIFPERRDLAGYFLVGGGNSGWEGDGAASAELQTSGDSTNGIDGSWSAVVKCRSGGGADQQAGAANVFIGTAAELAGRTYSHDWGTYPSVPVAGRVVTPYHRRVENVDGSGIVSLSGAAFGGVRALRFLFTGNPSLAALHLYGARSSGQVADRLAFWHPALDVEVPSGWFDWGDVPLGSSADKKFRLKNLSPGLTANDLDVFVDAPMDTLPSVAAQQSLSLDGLAFLDRVAIGGIAPGGITMPVTIRRVTPSNAVTSSWSARVIAQIGSWSA